MSDTEKFEGLNRAEIINRVKVMISGANPNFSKTEVQEIAEQTATQYIAERDDGAELLDI